MSVVKTTPARSIRGKSGFRGQFRLRRNRDDGDHLPPPPSSFAELYHSRDSGKEGIIPAFPDAGTGVELGSPLTNQDGTRLHHLAAKSLDPQPFGLAIASVFGFTA